MFNKNISLKTLVIIILPLFLLLAFLLWKTIGSYKNGFGTASVSCKTSFKFINPQPGCEISEQEELTRFGALEAEITDFINIVISAKQATRISVFFRDLETKRWIGVNINENYTPGSLFKLPLMIAYLKIAEIQSEILSQKFEYKDLEDINKLRTITPSHSLEEGKTYTIEELINYMIIYSDNDATALLYRNLNQQYLNKVYTDLGVYIPTSGGIDQNFLSVQTYAAILRSLYNASYLNRTMSEKALELLNNSEFKEGLTAGVPSSVRVAHKFGEKVAVDPGNGTVLSRELHDCGIVYFPDRPYIICIMAEGINLKNLQDIIKNISHLTYKKFASE